MTLGLIIRAQNIVGKDSASVGQGNAFRYKWIKKDGTDLVLVATEEPEDTMQKLLQHIQHSRTVSDAKQLNDLKKKKLVTVTKVITSVYYSLRLRIDVKLINQRSSPTPSPRDPSTQRRCP